MTVQTDDAIVPSWTFGDRVRKARSISKMDQREFALALGVTASSIAAWETDRAVPRDIVSIARRIYDLTHIPPQWTLGLDDTPPYNPGPWSSGPVPDLPRPSRRRREQLSGYSLHTLPTWENHELDAAA